METRASHFLVGALLLILIFAGAGVAIWSRSHGEHAAMVSHFARFAESIDGLSVGSEVLFGGIPVGQVTAAYVDPADSSLARVDMIIQADVPIRTDSVATLEMQGFTGRVLVEISRGTTNGALIAKGSEIPSRYSALEHILNNAPLLVSKANEMFDGLDKFITADNVAAARRILGNARKLMDLVSTNSDEITSALKDVTAAGKQISSTNAEFKKLGADMGAFGDRLAANFRGASRDASLIASVLGTTFGVVAKVIDENRRPIRDFTAAGLQELPMMIVDVDRVVATFKRIWTAMAQNPGQYLLQDRQSGFAGPGPTKPER